MRCQISRSLVRRSSRHPATSRDLPAGCLRSDNAVPVLDLGVSPVQRRESGVLADPEALHDAADEVRLVGGEIGPGGHASIVQLRALVVAVQSEDVLLARWVEQDGLLSKTLSRCIVNMSPQCGATYVQRRSHVSRSSPFTLVRRPPRRWPSTRSTTPPSRSPRTA